MKKQTTFIIAILTSQFALSQVGINNTSPQATLDVTAKTTNGSKPEGFIAPRLTGDQIKSADTRYGTAQTGTVIYATSAVSSPVVGSKTEFITAAGYYFYDGSKWQKLSGSGVAYSGSTSVTLNGTSFERPALTGDVTASANSNATTVAKIQGKSVSTTVPTNGQVLKYNTTTSAWEPSSDAGLTSETDGVIGNEVKSATTNGGLTLSGSGTSASPYTLGLPTTGVTSGQVMKWDGTKWALASDAGLTSEVDGIVGNEVTSATTNGGLTVSGSGTAASPYTVGLPTTGVTSGQIMKWDGTKWAPSADTDTNTTYTGSTSVTLNGTAFERPALTGDVTASANSNATTVAKIQGTAVSSSAPTTAGESLIYNGTSWGPSSNTLTVSPEVTTGTYTVKATDYFIRLNPTAAIVYINLPSTGIPVGKVIHIVNKGNKQANFLWDNVAPSGTLFYDESRPAVIGGGYSGTLVYLGGAGQGAWSFVVTY